MSQYNEADVRALWRCARTHNSTIPDEALDAMRDALAATLRQQAARVDDGSLLQLIRDARHRICNDAPNGLGKRPFDDPVYGPLLRRLDAADAALSAQPAPDPDDAAVDAFAAAMKAKLASARAKGRGGWQDKDECSQQQLSDMLRTHVEKGDPRDVANFCMFLHQRGEAIQPAPERQGEVCPNCGASCTKQRVWDEAGGYHTYQYTHPATPVGVPDRKGDPDDVPSWVKHCADAAGVSLYIAGWNNCLDAILAAAPSAPQGTQQGVE